MFFLLSYEGFRQVAPTVSTTRVPTAAERATVTDPISKSLLQFWPAPTNLNAPAGTNNFIANVGATLYDETGLATVDDNITEKDHLTVPGLQYGGTLFTPGALPLLAPPGNCPSPDA